MRLAPVFVVLLTAIDVFALNELGSLEDAKRKHPAVFVPGNVMEYVISEEEGYVYSGESEKCFSGSMSEKDSELYQEAELEAKKNLLTFFSDRKPGYEAIIRGGRKIYEYPDGNMRRVVFFVKKDSVIFQKIPSTLSVKKNESTTTVDKGTFEKVASEIVRSNVVTTVDKAVCSNKIDAVKKDPLTICLEKIKKDPADCVAMSRAAKIYVRQGDMLRAGRMYGLIVKCVINDEKIDKDFGADLLLEAARFEKKNGDVNVALKYYRLVIRCNGLRRWNLDAPITEANKNIAILLQESL